MTQTTFDHSGRLLPSPPPRDDGYQYNINGTTQPGDGVYSRIEKFQLIVRSAIKHERRHP